MRPIDDPAIKALAFATSYGGRTMRCVQLALEAPSSPVGYYIDHLGYFSKDELRLVLAHVMVAGHIP